MRVATIPLQKTTMDAIRRSQEALADTQAQLSTGKKAPDIASLGTEAVRTLSAHSMLARQEAQGDTAKRLGTTLSLYDANISTIEDEGMSLSKRILTAIGSGDAAGLNEAIDSAFSLMRSALNGQEGGVPLFGGGSSQPPFKPEKIADLIGIDPADAFTNGTARASARVGDRLDVQYGVLANEVGTDMVKAFQSLAAIGPFDQKLTDAQSAALKSAQAELETGITTVRKYNADNGRRQAQAETLVTRADERSLVLNDVIARNEDADLGQVAMDLAQQQTMLRASYSVFSQLNSMSLVDYLR
ncbi:flagellar hook-associated protein 3 FlgL [Stakelama pacifica]|uniref:Flagellar hook-associated protein 3 FlgL n=2 Tax=Stakelama pacifica TaxID=517720 RepID=A0A4R6FIA1_9SPHN|nr:flagellar hook-associated protein 3 FlgL [Stakelama pacifica]GGO96927.1 flagellar hook-associated protein FlgL [Stakelama pacifica]